MIDLTKASNLAQLDTNLSVGELSEHQLHRTIKYLIDPDSIHHEQKINKKIVDIYDGKMIYEVQTKQFKNLVDKLKVLLDDYQVMIVYPLVQNKKIITINRDNEVIKKTLSPKKGYLVHSLIELYQIKDYLDHPNLQVKILMVDITEFKEEVPKTKKYRHGVKRINQYLNRINDELVIHNTDEAISLIPNMKELFTAKEFYQKCHISPRKGSFIMSFAKARGVIKQSGKQGRSYLYHIYQKEE